MNAEISGTQGLDVTNLSASVLENYLQNFPFTGHLLPHLDFNNGLIHKSLCLYVKPRTDIEPATTLRVKNKPQFSHSNSARYCRLVLSTPLQISF